METSISTVMARQLPMHLQQRALHCDFHQLMPLVIFCQKRWLWQVRPSMDPIFDYDVHIVVFGMKSKAKWRHGLISGRKHDQNQNPSTRHSKTNRIPR
jgi:hypothetical protein